MKKNKQIFGFNLIEIIIATTLLTMLFSWFIWYLTYQYDVYDELREEYNAFVLMNEAEEVIRTYSTILYSTWAHSIVYSWGYIIYSWSTLNNWLFVNPAGLIFTWTWYYKRQIDVSTYTWWYFLSSVWNPINFWIKYANIRLWTPSCTSSWTECYSRKLIVK